MRSKRCDRSALHKLIADLSQRFDRIVFDSAPCHAGSDTFVLSNQMDAVVLVIHATKTGMRAVQGSVKQLRADRKSTRLNSSHVEISYAVFCLKKKKKNEY